MSVFIPDTPTNVSLFIKPQEDTSEHPQCSTLQPRGLSESGVQLMGLLVGMIGTYFGNHLNLCVLWHLGASLLWYLPPGQPDSDPLGTSILKKPLADHSGHLAGEAGMWDRQSRSRGVECQWRTSRGHDRLLALELDLAIRGASVLGRDTLPTISTAWTVKSRDTPFTLRHRMALTCGI